MYVQSSLDFGVFILILGNTKISYCLCTLKDIIECERKKDR